MSNAATTLQTPEALVESAVNYLKEHGHELEGQFTQHIQNAQGDLVKALERVRGSTVMGVEAASKILLDIGKKRQANGRIDREALEGMVRKASDIPAGVITKLANAAVRNKVTQLIVKQHSGKAASIAGLVTLMAAWLWPNHKQELTLPDGSVEASEKWGFAKTTAVAVGAVLSAGLLAHYARGKLAQKIIDVTAGAAIHVR